MLKPRLTPKGQPINRDCMVNENEYLLGKRMVFLDGEMTGSTQGQNLLLAMSSMSQEPIKLTISSPGGSLDSAFMLYDVMRLSPAPIWTLGRWVCSAAVIPLAAGVKGHRYLLPHSKVMLHLPSTEMSGDSKEIAIRQIELEKYKQTMLDILIECGAKKKREDILIDIDREMWMTSEETIKYGLADSIVSKKELNSWLV